MSTLSHNLLRACAHPRDAWNSLRHWALLAQYAQLPYADVMRYRLELRDNKEFQAHLERCRSEIQYIFPEAAELYVVVRAAKPKVVVETGVASGISSAHILLALAANGAGTLHSIDFPNVQQGSMLPQGRTSGWIVPEALRGRWMLQLGHSRELLPDLLRTLDQVDLFLHDSDHSYQGMWFEFEQALPRLKHGGLLMSDDTHLHSAWDDFCAKHHLRPTRIGHLGVTRKR
jgi:predicted O-methyltransferase YrrM